MSRGKRNRNPGWKSGGHWTNCEVCGFTYRNQDLKERWDGLITCKEDWEPRHRQDITRAVKDDTSPKGIHRAPPVDVFIDVAYLCGPSTARTGAARAGCARSGSTSLFELAEQTIPSGTFNNSL